MKRYFLVLLLTFFVPKAAFAELEPEQIVDRFFTYVGTAKLDDAFNGLVIGSSIEKLDPTWPARLRKEVESIQKSKIYGMQLDFEKIRTEQIGKRTQKLVYHQNFPVTAITWTFYFYKADERWSLAHVEWNNHFIGASAN
jgi:hypothetical protein